MSTNIMHAYDPMGLLEAGMTALKGYNTDVNSLDSVVRGKGRFLDE